MKKIITVLAFALCAITAFARPGHPGGPHHGGFRPPPPVHRFHHPHYHHHGWGRGWGWGLGGFAAGYVTGSLWNRSYYYNPYYATPVVYPAPVTYTVPAVRVITPGGIVYRSW